MQMRVPHPQGRGHGEGHRMCGQWGHGVQKGWGLFSCSTVHKGRGIS